LVEVYLSLQEVGEVVVGGNNGFEWFGVSVVYEGEEFYPEVLVKARQHEVIYSKEFSPVDGFFIFIPDLWQVYKYYKHAIINAYFPIL